MGTGTIESIHLIAEHEGPPEPVEAVIGDPGLGLRGDRHHGRRGGDDLTLIESEALEQLAEAHGVDLPPGTSRRNVTTRGVDLGTLIGRRFRVGDAVCEGEERCEPCSHLAQLTEPDVLRGLVHTGLSAAIVEGGTIRVGDAIEPLD
jgi:MOSC domain-containing protein YiiM